MSSIVQTIQKRTTNKHQSLPISSRANNGPKPTGPTRRLSSASVLQMQQHPKSLSYSVTSWWAWAWAWIVSCKPIFVRDLEMNDEEKHAIGFQNRGSFMHGFFKAKSHLRKLFRFNDVSSLPQTLRYDHPRADGRFNRAPIF